VDRSYKEDIPKAKRALEALKKEFSGVASSTDWTKLRIEPLLDHVKALDRLLRSSKFARETARLRRGVVMFHSDLVYLRENVKALKEILEIEKKSHQRRPVSRAPGR
jgi:negative regulator of replication initiation